MIIILYSLATEVTGKIVHLLRYMYSSNFFESILLVGVTLLLQPTFYTHFGRFVQEKKKNIYSVTFGYIYCAAILCIDAHSFKRLVAC